MTHRVWTIRSTKPGDAPVIGSWCLIEKGFLSNHDSADKPVSIIGGSLGPICGYQLDAGTNPKQIYLYDVDYVDFASTPVYREASGTVRLGLYELTETTLRIQFSKPGEPAPTELVSDESRLPAGQWLLTMDRKLDERLLKPLSE